MSAEVIHMPRPQAHDMGTIVQGRFRALRQYQDAQTDAERRVAMVFFEYWRDRYEHAKALRRLG